MTEMCSSQHKKEPKQWHFAHRHFKWRREKRNCPWTNHEHSKSSADAATVRSSIMAPPTNKNLDQFVNGASTTHPPKMPTERNGRAVALLAMMLN